MIGIGDTNSQFIVYIGNRPDYGDLNHLTSVRPIKDGEIADIGVKCGNGWRKVFNVYAKLVFALNASMHFVGLADENQTGVIAPVNRWQAWRDVCLLKEHSNSLMLFSKPDLATKDSDVLRIVMGKGWAKECGLEPVLHWLNNDFAISKKHNLIVCPYFDYRQLSNQKIVLLCELIRPFLAERNAISGSNKPVADESLVIIT